MHSFQSMVLVEMTLFRVPSPAFQLIHTIVILAVVNTDLMTSLIPHL
jgi:hypothetical protein